MMRNDGFELMVADWLHERADWTEPAYLDEVLSKRAGPGSGPRGAASHAGSRSDGLADPCSIFGLVG